MLFDGLSLANRKTFLNSLRLGRENSYFKKQNYSINREGT
jgi:hypothetical protein